MLPQPNGVSHSHGGGDLRVDPPCAYACHINGDCGRCLSRSHESMRLGQQNSPTLTLQSPLTPPMLPDTYSSTSDPSSFVGQSAIVPSGLPTPPFTFMLDDDVNMAQHVTSPVRQPTNDHQRERGRIQGSQCSG